MAANGDAPRAWVWLRAVLAAGDPTLMYVAVGLASYSDGNLDKPVWPSIGTLCAALKFSERSVERKIAALVKLGLLSNGPRVKGRATTRSFILPTLAHPSHQTPVTTDTRLPCGLPPAPQAADPRHHRQTELTQERSQELLPGIPAADASGASSASRPPNGQTPDPHVSAPPPAEKKASKARAQKPKIGQADDAKPGGRTWDVMDVWCFVYDEHTGAGSCPEDCARFGSWSCAAHGRPGYPNLIGPEWAAAKAIGATRSGDDLEPLMREYMKSDVALQYGLSVCGFRRQLARLEARAHVRTGAASAGGNRQ